MAKKDDDKETERKRDEVLKRMLQTPPKPRRPSDGKPAKKESGAKP